MVLLLSRITVEQCTITPIGKEALIIQYCIYGLLDPSPHGLTDSMDPLFLYYVYLKSKINSIRNHAFGVDTAVNSILIMLTYSYNLCFESFVSLNIFHGFEWIWCTVQYLDCPSW